MIRRLLRRIFGPRIRMEDVNNLLFAIRAFNAGAIDAPLDRHIDAVFESWCRQKGIKP